MQKAKKAKVTAEEIQLKNLGREKFKVAQELTAGRDYLGVVSDRDTTQRNKEKLLSLEALQLGKTDLMDNAEINPLNVRSAARSGVAAAATSDEDRFAATRAILDADLGNTSAVSSSTRTAAASKARLEEALLKEDFANRAATLNILGSVAGAGATAYSAYKNVDPLANPSQKGVDINSAVDAQLLYDKVRNPFDDLVNTGNNLRVS